MMTPFEPFKCKEFIFGERRARIFYPKGEPNGKIVLKAEYLAAFPYFDVAMLERGYYLIFIEHQNRWASDDEIEVMAEFVRYCAKELNASERCIFEGMSCGGLQAAKLAEAYPELCAVMYLDAPVLNILSMAGLGECKNEAVDQFWREIVATYDVDRSSITAFRESPIDHMDVLIENNIPVYLLYGNADDIVLFAENGMILEKFYKKHGGTIKVVSKSCMGHHPHCLEDPTPIIEFVEQFM